MLLQEDFIWTSANSGTFITYICVRDIMCCLCLLEIYMTLVLEILSAITDVHHQAGILPIRRFCRRRWRRTPMRSKLWVRAYNANKMPTGEEPWKRNESASNRQLEYRRNAMELRRNAKVAVGSPWKRHLQKNSFSISRRSGKFNNAVQSQWQRR